MKKCAFLIFHKDVDQFLEKLRNLGLVHLDVKKVTLEGDSALEQQSAWLSESLQTLAQAEKRFTEQPEKLQNTKQQSLEEGQKAFERLEKIRNKEQDITQQINMLDREARSVEVWGDFDSEVIKSLAESGYELDFYVAATKDYNPEWGGIVIQERGSSTYFVKVNRSNEERVDLELADSIPQPQKSYREYAQEKDELTSLLNEIIDESDQVVLEAYTAMQNLVNSTKDTLTFEQVKLGIDDNLEGRIFSVKGYIPEEDEKSLTDTLESEQVYYEIDEVSSLEDDVPVKLKNNSFAKLFEPISDLYSKPKYGELDLTPYFAPFYMIFFGFCLSDAGYGLLYLVLVTFFKAKAPKEAKSVFSLGQLLSISTIVFGLISGVFLGIELYKTGLPVYRDLRFLVDPKLEGPKLHDILFNASLAMGGVQILLGMFLRGINTKRVRGGVASIAPFSWFVLALTSAINYFVVVQWQGGEFMNLPYMIIAGASVIGIYLFNTPGKSILMNIGVGLWDTYNALVGGVGDLLSYLRLFALGLASGILGLVFNDLGTGVYSVDQAWYVQLFTIIIMLFILVAGHAINLFMSSIGSLVHPLRLIFVEFYKNAGYQGGGKVFSAFKKEA